MLPRYNKAKGMLIQGHYWLIHPQTGVPWTEQTVAEFIGGYEVHPQSVSSGNKLVSRMKKLVGGIKAFNKTTGA